MHGTGSAQMWPLLDHMASLWQVTKNSIKALGCMCWCEHNVERFHRNICKARDGDKELSNIKKLLYLGPQQQTHNLFLHNMGNKTAWQLHQLILHLLSLLHQQDQCIYFCNIYILCLSMFTSPFPLSTFSKQTSTARSQLRLFSPESPLGLIGVQTIPMFPHLPHQLSSSTLLLLWFPMVHPLSVISPPAVTSSVCSWKSFFLSSVISPREICESWTECLHPRLIPWGKEYHWARKTTEVRRWQPVFLEKHVTVKLYLHKSSTFCNRLSSEHGISQGTWNLILSIDSQVKATVRAAGPIPVST